MTRSVLNQHYKYRAKKLKPEKPKKKAQKMQTIYRPAQKQPRKPAQNITNFAFVGTYPLSKDLVTAKEAIFPES